jgi:hypothetical protein
MDFKLNEYHQGVSDDDLLSDVKRVAGTFGDKYLSITLYTSIGKYSESTFRSRFGSWTNVLQRLGLRAERNSIEMQRISDEMMIADLIDVSKRLNKSTITSSEYYKHGKYSGPTISQRFGSWAEFVKKAGLEQTGFIKKVEDVELFDEIERIWTALEKQPTTTDMKKGISKYSLDTFTRRFGGWRNALIAFIEYINAEVIEGEYAGKENEQQENKNEETQVITSANLIQRLKKRTPRNINLKLRFKVLQRDHFKCCSCGASPAKNHGIELHIDHIIPWSNGGETEIGNLQTLCSKCNLGKSNM